MLDEEKIVASYKANDVDVALATISIDEFLVYYILAWITRSFSSINYALNELDGLLDWSYIINFFPLDHQTQKRLNSIQACILHKLANYHDWGLIPKTELAWNFIILVDASEMVKTKPDQCSNWYPNWIADGFDRTIDGSKMCLDLSCMSSVVAI